MAAVQNNVTILNESTEKWASVPVLVASGGVATIQSGTPTKGTDATAASWTGAIIPMVDGDGTASNARFTGICKTSSNETASVAGTAVVWLPFPGMVYACKSKSLTDTNTAAKILALFGKRSVFDLTSSLWSVDISAADAAANMLVVVGGDPLTSTLWFVYKNTGTFLGQIA